MTTTKNNIPGLKPSERMPVLFLGHGSPMNAIENNPFRRAWQQLGQEFQPAKAAHWSQPQLILCISAHWLTQGWWLTGNAQPKTIHDFGGFPQALFDEQYPAPGAPDLAHAIGQTLHNPSNKQSIGLDHAWGFDHGAWSVLKPMFPEAQIPVVQLSMDYSRPPSEHYALGQQLRELREQGVLIVASGNTVHNLRAIRDGEPYTWAFEFDQEVAKQITEGHLEELTNFQSMGEIAKLAHPSHDHFLPLLYAAGAAYGATSKVQESVRFFNDDYQLGSIAMRSVIWG